MVITVGRIDIEDKIKEALTNTRVHPETGESLPAGEASFSISVTQFVSAFNREEGIILKNLPDGSVFHFSVRFRIKVSALLIEGAQRICGKHRKS